MNSKLNNSQEIKNVAKAIEAMQLPRIMGFADMVLRHVEVMSEGNTSRLNTYILSFLIARGGEKGLTHSELARLLVRSNHSMTRLIDSLQKDGLITRNRDPKDRRAVYIKITSAGLKFMRKYIDEIALIEKKVLSCLDKNELEILTILIRKIRGKLEELRA